MKLLRKNQLQIALQLLICVLLIRYGLLKPLHIDIALSDFEFILFLVSFFLIYAGSLILFMIIKHEKHPERNLIKNSEKAYYNYLGINALGIGISFFLANEIGSIGYFGFFLALAAILYLYITQWMKIALVNNIVFACIAAYPIYIASVLDLLPKIDFPKLGIPYMDLLVILLYYGILITLMFFIKTLVLDLKDVNEDKEHHKKTLATLHGIEKGAIRTSYLIFIPVLLICVFLFYYYEVLQTFSIYLVVATVLPLIVLFFQLNKSKNIEQFKISNKILNVIIWLTIFSIVFLFFNIKNYGTS